MALYLSAQAGNKDSFAKLYDQHSALLFSIACSILRDEEEAKEVLQELFAKIWRSKIIPPPNLRSVSAWLTTVTRNASIDRYRKIQRRATHEVTTYESDWIEKRIEKLNDSTAADLLAKKELAQELLKALSEVDPKQAKALYLSFYSGLSQQEIADRLEIPLGTAKTLIRRSLLLLKQKLQKSDDRRYKERFT
ncbi:MAG: sigma-70 family RNA polymerase sigma factor [Verrucomicrobiota bacterium]